MRHEKMTQRVKVVSLDDEICVRPDSVRKVLIKPKPNELIVDLPVPFNGISFPYQPEMRMRVSTLNEFYEFSL